MTRFLGGDTAGTGAIAPDPAPHRYHARNLDPGERPRCTCGVADRTHPIHRIPSPRAAAEETTA